MEKIKAFGVFRGKELDEAQALVEDGCGSPYTKAVGIYLNDFDAVAAKDDSYGSRLVVVPVEIRYTLPSKRKITKKR